MMESKRRERNGEIDIVYDCETPTSRDISYLTTPMSNLGYSSCCQHRTAREKTEQKIGEPHLRPVCSLRR